MIMIHILTARSGATGRRLPASALAAAIAMCWMSPLAASDCNTDPAARAGELHGGNQDDSRCGQNTIRGSTTVRDPSAHKGRPTGETADKANALSQPKPVTVNIPEQRGAQPREPAFATRPTPTPKK
jgi:hypothetical protein